MPYVYLTGKPDKTQEALGVLRHALVPPEGKSRRIVVVSTDTAGTRTDPLDGGHSFVQDVFLAKTPSGADAGSIVIRHLQGLDIQIPTTPVSGKVKNWSDLDMAYIEHRGDFVNIVVPYWAPGNQTRTAFKKWCIIIRDDRDADE